MTQWVRYTTDSGSPESQASHFGQWQPDDGLIHELSGNFLDPAQATLTGKTFKPEEVSLLTPTHPQKVIALWNNYHALAKEKGLAQPQTPLYLIKPPNTYLANGGTIHHPAHYSGDVFYEGELGIVIGRHAKDITDPKAAADCICGYTCINDVTAFGLLKEDSSFDQWTRAKGFDTFCVMGPNVTSGLDYADLTIQTLVNGEEKQNYSAGDMMMPPNEIVMRLSQNMSLFPGDVICCGTNVGLGPMPRGAEVTVRIEGIGEIGNAYE